MAEVSACAASERDKAARAVTDAARTAVKDETGWEALVNARRRGAGDFTMSLNDDELARMLDPARGPQEWIAW